MKEKIFWIHDCYGVIFIIVKKVFEKVMIMRFGMYFEITLNKNRYFHVEIHTNYSCTHMPGSSGAYASSHEKLLEM